ncbi:MAG: selenide, water dikinase SelD [Halieaceae bacterium]
MISTVPTQDLVLLGGGHSHALALRMLAMQPPRATRITLVSDSSYAPYSGMLPGLVAGHYDYFATHIDLRRLCSGLGIRFIEAVVTSIDAGRKQVKLSGRPALEYDVLSINIGAQPDLDTVPGAREFAVPVKPVSNFYRRWQSLEQRLQQRQFKAGAGIVLVGGGAGSVELALAMRHRLAAHDMPVRLLCGDQLLMGYNAGARAAVRRACQRMGVSIHEQCRVSSVMAGRLEVVSGERFEFEELVWCTAVVATDWLRDSGLRCDDQGYLAIDDSLQVVDHAGVFAAGDVAVQLHNPRPRAGVFAVRQAPVLAFNLAAYLEGRPLRQHRPQRRFLSLLSLGDRQAVADRGPLWTSGAWVWRWKDSIDRRFMAGFVELPSMSSDPGEPAAETQMPCGGCGAKIPAATLRSVLAELVEQYPATIDQGQLGEDAALIEWPAGQRLVQSVDSLRPLLDDPWTMGRIAVLHALSDIYAMGAKPHSALVHLSLPYAASDLQQRELYQLMSGILLELERAGCKLVGGHSMEAPELSVGITANGELAPGSALPKTIASAGLKLVLTKPLGTGTIFAAAMENRAPGEAIKAACVSMLQSNRDAAEIARQAGVLACTDITGFGLLGHLLEMVQGTDLCVVLRADQVPALPQAQELAESGIRSSLHPANVEALGRQLQEPAVAAQQHPLLFDPQTSGGLLLAIADSAAADIVVQLQAAGYAAALIGEVEPLKAREHIRLLD